MTAILLFSGGLDSYIAWRLLGQPACLYVDLGHRYAGRERETIRRLERLTPELAVHCEPGRLHLGDIEQADGHIAHRNLLLASVAALRPDVDTVYLGALRGESSGDKSAVFLRLLSATLSQSERRPIRVTAPYRHLTKAGLVRQYLSCFPEERTERLFLRTRSCYAATLPEQYAGCGRCMACFRRWVALTLNGLQENYQADPATWQAVQNQHWRNWLASLSRFPLWEWPGILQNNLEAYWALQEVV